MKWPLGAQTDDDDIGPSSLRRTQQSYLYHELEWHIYFWSGQKRWNALLTRTRFTRNVGLRLRSVVRVIWPQWAIRYGFSGGSGQVRSRSKSISQVRSFRRHLIRH